MAEYTYGGKTYNLDNQSDRADLRQSLGDRFVVDSSSVFDRASDSNYAKTPGPSNPFGDVGYKGYATQGAAEAARAAAQKQGVNYTDVGAFEAGGGTSAAALKKNQNQNGLATASPTVAGQGQTSTNFTFDPANADRALRAGLGAAGFDANNPNGAAGVFLRRASDLERLFPILAAINPGQFGTGSGNANSPTDSQSYFSNLPNNFEGIIGQNPQDLLSKLFSNNDATTPFGQLQLRLSQDPGELASTLSAILGLNSSPYVSSFMDNYLRNLALNVNSNAGLLNSHGGNLLGAVQEALRGVKTFQ